MSHTPGPWKLVYEGDAEHGYPAIVIGECLKITISCAESFGDPLSDARLIAAAPEMYKVLKLIEKHGPEMGGDWCLMTAQTGLEKVEEK